MEIKQALNDAKFRDTLPTELREDLVKYLQCPSCVANITFLRKVLKQAGKQLREYYPDGDLHDIETEDKQLAANYFSVINCHINELENKLRELGSGRLQLAIARYQDQVTVVVNQLAYI
jgi:hypothetical protein